MTYIFIFLLWTFYLYVIHRIIHKVGLTHFPLAFNAHADHHKYINTHEQTAWHWNNLFLFNDTWASTLDLWLTEVVPTLVFAAITGHWWIFAFYYLWAALVQETIEHNPNVNLYPFSTSGKWHLIHHQDAGSNFGLFFPIWDIMFKTHKKVEAV